MVTHKTLEDFLRKCQTGLGQVESQIVSTREQLRTLELSEALINGQIQTLEQLMNADNTQSVELPMGGDKIEELFDERLGNPEFPDETEMRKIRQEGVYKEEATGMVNQLDEINKREDNNGEGSEVDPS